MRRQTRIAVAVLMVVVGGLWCVQGLGWLGGSAMTGHPIWAVIGGVVVVGGIVGGARAARGADTSPTWASGPSPEAQQTGRTARSATEQEAPAPEQQPDQPAHPPAKEAP